MVRIVLTIFLYVIELIVLFVIELIVLFVIKTMKRQRECEKIKHVQYGLYKIVVDDDGYVEFIINPVDTHDESPNKMFKKNSDLFTKPNLNIPEPELNNKDKIHTSDLPVTLSDIYEHASDKTINDPSDLSDTLSDGDEDDMHTFLGTTSYHSTSSLMSIVNDNHDRKFSIKVVEGFDKGFDEKSNYKSNYKSN